MVVITALMTGEKPTTAFFKSPCPLQFMERIMRLLLATGMLIIYLVNVKSERELNQSERQIICASQGGMPPAPGYCVGLPECVSPSANCPNGATGTACTNAHSITSLDPAANLGCFPELDAGDCEATNPSKCANYENCSVQMNQCLPVANSTEEKYGYLNCSDSDGVYP